MRRGPRAPGVADVQPAGRRAGRVRRRGAGERHVRCRLRLHVYPMRFPERPTLHFGGWDYTNVTAHYEVTVENKPALLQHLREHFVDSPWATATAMPYGKHDATGAMVEPPDTANFDEWLKLWPDAGRYCVFPSVSGSFQEWTMGTPEFERAVADWAKFWAGKMRENETRAGSVDGAARRRANAPRAGCRHRGMGARHPGVGRGHPGVGRYHTSAIRREASTEMLELCDVLCPNRPKISARLTMRIGPSFSTGQNGRTARAWPWNSTRAAAHAAARPLQYCRLQGWDCWRYGADGLVFLGVRRRRGRAVVERVSAAAGLVHAAIHRPERRDPRQTSGGVPRRNRRLRVFA